MKVRFLNRDIEVTKSRINICNFKGEKILIGRSFNKKEMNIKSYKILILMIFMPYDYLNKRFLNKRL